MRQSPGPKNMTGSNDTEFTRLYITLNGSAEFVMASAPLNAHQKGKLTPYGLVDFTVARHCKTTSSGTGPMFF